MFKYNSWIFIFLFLLLFLALSFALLKTSPVLIWDEPVYLSNAASYLTPTFFTENFRFPLLELFILSVFVIFGIIILPVQILMILISAATIFTFFKITKFFIIKDYLRYLLTFFFAFSSVFLFWSYRIYPEISSIFFLLLSFLFIIRDWKLSNHNKTYLFPLLSGFFAALAFLMKFTSALFPFSIVITLIIFKHFKSLKNFVLGGLIPVIPWLISNMIVHKNPFWDFFAQAKIVGQYTNFQPALLFFKNIYSVFGILLILLLGLYFTKKYFWKQKHIFTLTLSSLFFIIYFAFFVNLKLERYVLFSFPLILLLIGISIDKIHLQKQIKKSLKPIFISIIIILIFLVQLFFGWNNLLSYQKNLNYCQTNGSLSKSIDFAKTNIPEGDLIISNIWTYYGFYGNHKISSIWSENKDDYFLTSNFAWIMISNNRGDSPPRKLIDNAIFRTNFTGPCDEVISLYTLSK